MDKVLHQWSRLYFIQPLLELFILIVLVKLFFSYKKIFSIHFILYLISFLITSSSFYFFSFNLFTDDNGYLYEFTNFIFALIEFFIFYKFFSTVTPSIKNNFIIKFTIIGVTLFILSLLLRVIFGNFTESEVTKTGEIICVAELSTLIFFCLYYFYDIYRENKPLHYHYSIIVIALFGYCIISIPFFSVAENLAKTNMPLYELFYSFHFISLLILCLAIGYYAFTAKEEAMMDNRKTMALF